MGTQHTHPARAGPDGNDDGHAGDQAHDPLRNRDVDWNGWPVQTYLTENYREPHPADLAVIGHHARFYRQLRPGSIDRSLEFGAGPNLYPLMLAASVSRSIQAVEPSAASVAYLKGQLRPGGADPSWAAFYQVCRRELPSLPPTLDAALSIVEVTHGTADDVPTDSFGLASMHFVAESVTEDAAEFADLCRRFVSAVRPGAPVVAAFMENMGRYRLGDGSTWPGLRVDSNHVTTVFAPLTTDLVTTRIEADATLPDYGYTGMVLLTARRATHEES